MTPEELRNALVEEAEAGGYHLNPDRGFVSQLAEGLLANRDRYGYQACPCRLASGNRSKDLDIICPCDYRDADLEEHGACYCALYVDERTAAGLAEAGPVPERRPATGLGDGNSDSGSDSVETITAKSAIPSSLPLPVWRCRVCGYLCARENPPGTCPICRASKDRFERFLQKL